MRAMGENILVKTETVGDETSGGIFLPDTANKNSLWAEIINVGPEVADDDIAEGSRVMLKPEAGVKCDGFRYVTKDEIIGVDVGGYAMKVLRDHVLVSQLKPEKDSKHIYLPIANDNKKNTNMNDCQLGVVVSVGNGYIAADGKRIPVELRAGDYVAFSGGITAGISIVINGEEYRVLKERDIIMTWTEDENG